MRQYELVERVKAYDPSADEELLNRAYVFAMKAHGAQLRASGDPYFSHPVEVAGILSAWKLDSASIATALLHDTIEDTGATLPELERLFGAEVARLVDGVTKLNKLELQSSHTEQAENFRKLLLAMSDDIRVLLVKLADRLHNMRTLHFIRKADKRRRIAAETIEIYAPLAERIGMQALKDELEDLAFAALWPDARELVRNRLSQLRKHDSNLIDRIVDELRQTLHDAGVEAEVYGREKTPFSIWRKMKRKNVSFEQLSDIMAFRIRVDSVPNCYAALGVIHGRYAMVPERFKDFISTPKPNAYRSLHTTIFGPERRRIEVQIRTRDMHEIAEMGVAAHWAYKQKRQLTDGRQYRWVRGLLEILEQASGPGGVPRAHQARDVPGPGVLLHPARRSDLPAAGGDADRLRLCGPLRGRRQLHRRQGQWPPGAPAHPPQPRRPGRDHHQQERLAVAGLGAVRRHRQGALAHPPLSAHPPAQRFHRPWPRAAAAGRPARSGSRSATSALEAMLEGLHHKSVEDLLAAIGEGALGARVVIEALRRDQQPAPPTTPAEAEDAKVVPLRRPRPSPAPDGREGLISGLLPGMAINFAGCCHPVPGDAIVGVVRTGRGIAIHRSDCRSLIRKADDPDRWLDLGWNPKAKDAKAIARLQIMTTNQPGSLGSLSTVVGKQGGNITDLRFGSRSPELYEIILDVEVERPRPPGTDPGQPARHAGRDLCRADPGLSPAAPGP